MNHSHCPYCHGIRSLMLGDVYCSQQQQKSMGELSTGTLYIKSKRLEETSDHVSRLSIRCMLRGEQHYKVGGNDHLVTPANYLLVNQGQHYKTSFESDREQEMILVAFQPGFAENLLYSLESPSEQLLDDPFSTSAGPVDFFEQTYDQDPVILHHFMLLRSLIDLDLDAKRETDLEGIYTSLLTRILHMQQGLQGQIDKLGAIKASTRKELFRRLGIARDFMEAHAGHKISLETIARAACLSVHHFKREFKALYGYSPHRYLFIKRMDKAKHLLSTTGWRVDDIAVACGFENTSSFIRQFKVYEGCTPGVYHAAKRAEFTA